MVTVQVGAVPKVTSFVVPAVLRFVERCGLELRGLATRHTSLEDVFVHLTGRNLRDGEGE